MNTTPTTILSSIGCRVARWIISLGLAVTAVLAAVGGGAVMAQSASPAASDAGGVPPNHFVLDGPDTHVGYDAETIDGGQTLRYDGPYGQLAFGPDAITSEASAIGQLITVDVGPFPDRGELWLTLVLPRFVPMTVGDAPVDVSTILIYRWEVSTIAGPPTEGALDRYEVVPLTGTAELVMP